MKHSCVALLYGLIFCGAFIEAYMEEKDITKNKVYYQRTAEQHYDKK